MSVESIKAAIAELTADQKTSLASWLIHQDNAEWDRQMEEDFLPGGRGMALLEEAEADIKAGGVEPMDELFAKMKARPTSRQTLS